ncbi:unnamed protein product [Angiostrongylus costaricensis]|uniref:Tudor domain-containing protein n=1 Tax=Angiostrongylus costaricensis TaxID=334426 RepID=A0A0R3PF36_ANGCS|nr:unnamed protein product [Angiostrongylus costaricensis]
MLKAVLGPEQSKFIVNGLPPLELQVGKDGFFDGFITFATGMDNMWLMPTMNNKWAIDSAAVLFPLQPLNLIQKGSLAVVRLQYNKNAMSWTRVLVESRPDAAHANVYLVDSGARQMVNVRSLYEMPLEMKRFPPQAIPVLPSISSSPDLAPGEWGKLANVRITVRMNAVKENRFVCDQLTVYEAFTRADLDFGAAIRNGIELERANFSFMPMDDKRYNIIGPPQIRPSNDAFLIDQSSQGRPVFYVSIIGVLMAVASLLLIIGYAYRRVQVERAHRREDVQEPP